MHVPKKPPIPDRPTRTKVAAFAGCDERTVKRYLLGRSHPYPATKRALDDALRALGIQPPEVRS
jgi:hypothetical protein